MAAGTAHVLWFEECDASSTATVGGKCASLGEMLKAGIAVPPGFAVTTGAYEEFLERSGTGGIISELVAGVQFDDLHSVQVASEAIESAIVSAALPEDVEQAVRTAYDDLSARAGTSDVPVAVRSSATTEDLATASFAGPLETFLWVRGRDDVARHVLRCWAGLYSANALTYRERLGESSENPLMSVGVQQMVEARAAGVVFTLDPVSGDRSKIALEAAWGLGEGVVSGTVDPDRCLVDKVTLEILSRAVSVKEVEYRLDPETSTVIASAVPEERRAIACLDDAEVLELAAVAKGIERHYGRPQDIEWAMSGELGQGRVHVLQARAETVWSQREQPAPVVEVKSSSVEYVLADLLGRAGAARSDRDDASERETG
jgi:pyruvate,water dikinase